MTPILSGNQTLHQTRGDSIDCILITKDNADKMTDPFVYTG